MMWFPLNGATLIDLEGHSGQTVTCSQFEIVMNTFFKSAERAV